MRRARLLRKARLKHAPGMGSTGPDPAARPTVVIRPGSRNPARGRMDPRPDPTDHRGTASRSARRARRNRRPSRERGRRGVGEPIPRRSIVRSRYTRPLGRLLIERPAAMRGCHARERLVDRRGHPRPACGRPAIEFRAMALGCGRSGHWVPSDRVPIGRPPTTRRPAPHHGRSVKLPGCVCRASSRWPDGCTSLRRRAEPAN